MGAAGSRVLLCSVSCEHMRLSASSTLGRTLRGRATTCLLLRRVLETAFEKVLRRVLRCLAVGFKGRKGLEKGS